MPKFKNTRLKALTFGGGFLLLISLPFAFRSRLTDQPTQVPLLASVPTPTPTPTVNSQTVNSGDGKFTLTLTKRTQGPSSTYHLYTTDVLVSSNTTIFTLTQENTDYQLPFNSWSPNDKLFFVKQTQPNLRFLVYKTDGSPFASKETFIDVSELFRQKLPNLTLIDITGWASTTLLVIRTANADGSPNHHYWFDTSSNSFMRLSD